MSISNDQIYETLLGVSKDIGSLQATMEAHGKVFAQHLVDDARVVESVRGIELRLAKQRGAARTWGLIATAAGTLAGAVGAFFGIHHHG